MRWKLFPIHAALILRSNTPVIETLLKAYPEGVKMCDYKGMLPLHLDYQHEAQDSIMETLRNLYPEATRIKCKKGRTPFALSPLVRNSKKKGSCEDNDKRLEDFCENIEVKTTKQNNVEDLHAIIESRIIRVLPLLRRDKVTNPT